jgi:glycosyltransferase involved in cell wall biosynthesis
MSKLRISQVMLTAGFGGAERLFIDLCQDLAKDGHEVLAICHPLFRNISLLSHQRVTIAPLKAQLDWSPLSRYRLKNIFTAFRPQIVHTHLARGAAIAGDVAASLGIPAAANLHDYVNLKYYRNIKYFFPGTEDQQRYLIAKGIKPEVITVIPHFSNVPPVTMIAPFNDALPVLVAYGRFEANKGFHNLIKSVGLLASQGIKFRLLLGGDGPEKANLQALIDSLGLAGFVSLTGWVEDVAEFLDRGSYFILPSLQEAFGIVILEAMARGKTIISTAVKGPREILDDSMAYLVEAGDIDAMAKALAEALANRAEAQRRAANALAKYRQKYTSATVIPCFMKAYEQMLAAS